MTSGAPLADYFWIAGVDSVSYNDISPNTLGQEQSGSALPSLDNTIEEGSEHEGDLNIDDAILGKARAGGGAKHSRNNSWQRLSRLSDQARLSIQSLEISDTPGSNRSSVTIRAVNGSSTSGTSNGTHNGLGDFDFDTALLKFASERESFLDDLSFSAGVVKDQQAPMTDRPEPFKQDGGAKPLVGSSQTPFKKVGGTVRRKISFRDMSSMQRRPTAVARNGKMSIHRSA